MWRVKLNEEMRWFESLVTNRRLDDQTLRILESLFVSKDTCSLMQLKSALQTFLRSHSLSILRQASHTDFHHKLRILHFFVRAFAFIGDIQSCLAMRYEALLLREFKSSECDWLKVSHSEWTHFAQNLLHHGFYSIATLACDHALLSLRLNSAAEIRNSDIFDDVQIIETIKKIKDTAVKFAASSSGNAFSEVSVQAQTAEYLQKRRVEKRKTCPSFPGVSHTATTQFRDGIRKRNERKLSECHERVGW